MDETSREHLSISTLAADTLLAVGLTLFVWLQIWTPRLLFSQRPVPPGFRPIMRPEIVVRPGVYLLVALALLPLALRRRYPIGVLGVTAVAASFYQVLPLPGTMALLGPLVAVYTVWTLNERARAALATALAAVVLAVSALPAWGDERWFASLVTTLALVGGAAALGDATRNRRAYVAEMERRAEEAEARAEEEALRRIDEERLRIARELHDITAHSMSVIAVQSGAAAHVLESDPDAARAALGDIRRTSREALAELRSVVGALRAEGEEPGGAPLAPTPGLARVPELVHPLEEAGFGVGWELDFDPGEVPQLVEASAYRIVQEALTNVLRHARRHGHVMVSVATGEEGLRVEVVDDGDGEMVAPGRPDGHGISGMRERATALGGTFEAGPRPEGGWRVYAGLPLNRDRSA